MESCRNVTECYSVTEKSNSEKSRSNLMEPVSHYSSEPCIHFTKIWNSSKREEKLPLFRLSMHFMVNLPANQTASLSTVLTLDSVKIRHALLLLTVLLRKT